MSTEPIESELAKQVEYDMDEQGEQEDVQLPWLASLMGCRRRDRPRMAGRAQR